jgi:hypothetical protein
VRPACVRWRAPWLRWVGCEQVGQSPHGRDGHAPFFCAAKSNFKVTMVLWPFFLFDVDGVKHSVDDR